MSPYRCVMYMYISYWVNQLSCKRFNLEIWRSKRFDSGIFFSKFIFAAIRTWKLVKCNEFKGKIFLVSVEHAVSLMIFLIICVWFRKNKEVSQCVKWTVSHSSSYSSSEGRSFTLLLCITFGFVRLTSAHFARQVTTLERDLKNHVPLHFFPLPRGEFFYYKGE